MTVRKLVYKQGVAIKDYGFESQGVCWELCRRFIAGRIAGTWVCGETVWDVDTGRGGFSEVLTLHKQRNTHNAQNKVLDGLTSHDDAKRTSGCCTFKGLRSRTDVINHVLTVPGVYLFIMKDTTKGGHAMAFDSSRQGELILFDPNQGEFELMGESTAATRTFWSDFWEAKGQGEVNYKTAFHKGERELVRYTTI